MRLITLGVVDFGKGVLTFVSQCTDGGRYLQKVQSITIVIYLKMKTKPTRHEIKS